MLKHIILIALGGAIGSVFRFGLSEFIKNLIHINYHVYATLTVNFIGSFLIGIAIYQIQNNHWHDYMIYLFIIGFCGGFTTFSTFAYENFVFLNNQNYLQFFIYTALSIVICIFGVALGFLIIKN